jgi:Mg2+ and Co2+ transporter CorA
MDTHSDLPPELHKIYEKIKNTKKFTHTKISELKTQLFEMKVKYAENEKIYRIAENIDDNLDEENRKLNNLKMTVISALGTIFLPLGFITGFFGMNFNSMGNPTLKKGILAVKHVDKFIISLSIFSIIIISALYYVNF